MTEHSGSTRKRVAHCSCGSLRAETVGEPTTVATCFCEECQRRTGSAFGISTYWPRANVELSGSTTRYVREGQEGRKVTYYFCPNCGSSVYWELDRRPGQIGISGGSFLIRVYPPHHAQYGRDPNRVGSRSQTRSISHRIHRLLPRVDAAFAAITLSHVDRVPAAVESEIAQGWVIVRAATKWPLVSTLTLLDRKVVDAGNA